jgi:glyoxylase-like metal-dependent hydrolase (beta-lactamase superfamily II)
MELVALHCGDLRADAGLLYRGELSDDRVTVPIMCFLVVHDEGAVLFETGMNPEVRRDAIAYWGSLARNRLVPHLPDGATVIERVEQSTVAMTDLRYVVNSHLHNDHAGMNCEISGATVLVRNTEYAHATTLMDSHNTGYVRNDFYGDGSAAPQLIEYADTHDVFGDGTVTLVSTPGHSPGHQSLRVTFPSQKTFVISGDAVYQRASLCDGCPPGVLWDKAQAEASVQKLIAMDQSGDTVLVNHDPGQWAGVDDVQSLHRER